jgi:hypothetical protein
MKDSSFVFKPKKPDKAVDGKPKGNEEQVVQRNFSSKDAEQQAALDGQINLECFDYSIVPPDANVMIVGKRRFGKSTFLRYLLSMMWPFFQDGGYVFTKTKHNYFWQQSFPESRIYSGLNNKVLEIILEEQKKKYNKWLDGDLEHPPFVCLVFDDIISDESELRNNPVLNEIVFTGRHYFIFSAFCIQDPYGLGPKFRNNADIVAVTYQTSLRAVEALSFDYARNFGSNKKAFEAVLDKYTKDYMMLVVNQTKAETNTQKMFFWTRAEEEVEPYKIGDKVFWEESGCDWNEQVYRYRKKPTTKQKEWWKMALDRAKKEKKDFVYIEPNKYVMTNRSDKDKVQVVINSDPWFEREKKPKSEIEKAYETLKDVVKYRPFHPPKKNKNVS